MIFTKPSFSKIVFANITSIAILVYFSPVYSGIPNTNRHPTSFLGPGISLGYTTPVSYNSAFSLLGEAGEKNFRAGLTVGWQLDDSDRFKISGEYLFQNITYAFFSGTQRRWVEQGALGADYQHDINVILSPQLDLSGYFSHAPNKSLSTITGTYVNSAGISTDFIDARRIAGSNAGGAAAGIAIHPWTGAKVGVKLNYDHVRYDVIVISHSQVDGVGLGGTAFYNQAFGQHFTMGLLGSVRQPFNNYQVNLVYNKENWAVGVFGEYTRGQDKLPNTWNTGLSVNYYADDYIAPPVNLKNELDYKHETELPCSSREYCLDVTHRYAVVINPNLPPVPLDYRPKELGPLLPIIHPAASGSNQ